METGEGDPGLVDPRHANFFASRLKRPPVPHPHIHPPIPHTHIQMYRCTDVQMYRCTDVQIYSYQRLHTVYYGSSHHSKKLIR